MLLAHVASAWDVLLRHLEDPSPDRVLSVALQGDAFQHELGRFPMILLFKGWKYGEASRRWPAASLADGTP